MVMAKIPTKGAYKLFHDGVLAFAQMEAAGIRIDVEYLDKAIRKTKRKIHYLEKDIADSEVMRKWRRTFKSKTNMESNDQLGVILFDVMGFTCTTLTPTGKYKTDEKSLGSVDHPFVQTHLRIKKLRKILSTYLIGLRREVVDGFVHPVFNLHTVLTYRSSSNAPNFQNFPVRNKELTKLVRTAFIARPGHCLVEIDYSGLEVSIATCYHKDPAMIKDIEDPARDMHRDMAAECYRLHIDQVTKDARYCGKNMFVFPEFYGDWYISCARALWEAIGSMNLQTVDGMPLNIHLRQEGLAGLEDLNPKERPIPGTCEHHIQQVEQKFWEERYPIYAQWKKDWYQDYKDKGWFRSKTGFICQAFMKRNEAINYGVQGSAFHCLLQSLIWMQQEIQQRKMKAQIVGQIHDSIVADVPEGEVEEYLQLAQEITVNRLRKAWDWIIVKLEIEAEVSPVNSSWYDKKERKIG